MCDLLESWMVAFSTKKRKEWIAKTTSNTSPQCYGSIFLSGYILTQCPTPSQVLYPYRPPKTTQPFNIIYYFHNPKWWAIALLQFNNSIILLPILALLTPAKHLQPLETQYESFTCPIHGHPNPLTSSSLSLPLLLFLLGFHLPG